MASEYIVESKLTNTNTRKDAMEALGLIPDQEFYLKVYKPKTTREYNKLPKIGYVGIRDSDQGRAFLVRFKFTGDEYEFTSDIGFMNEEHYETAFNGLLSGKFIAVNQINLKDYRFYIYILDDINFAEYESEKETTEEEDVDLEELSTETTTISSVDMSDPGSVKIVKEDPTGNITLVSSDDGRIFMFSS